MKKTLIIVAALASAASVYAQGTIQFANNSGSTFRAPVYGVESGNAALELHGNSSSGVPAGSTVYSGSALLGAGYSAQLFGGPSSVTDSSALLPALLSGNPAVVTFRTATAAAGFVNAATVTIQGVNPGQSATLQVRAWDNMSGMVTSWDAAGTRGASSLFTSQPLGGDPGGGLPTLLPPALQGMTSFNIATTVPEPSTIALGVIGAVGFLMRRRK